MNSKVNKFFTKVKKISQVTKVEHLGWKVNLKVTKVTKATKFTKVTIVKCLQLKVY